MDHQSKTNKMKKQLLIITLLLGFNSIAQVEIFDTIIVSQKRSCYLYFDHKATPENNIHGVNFMEENNDIVLGLYGNIPDSSIAVVKVNDNLYNFRIIQTMDTLIKYQYYYKTNPDQTLVRARDNQNVGNGDSSLTSVPVIERPKRVRDNTSANGGFNATNGKMRSKTDNTSTLSSEGNQKSINAVIDNDNIKVYSGSTVNIRINEDYIIKNNTNNRNKIVIGDCIIKNSRAFITVYIKFENTSIEYEVYGIDNFKGLAVNRKSNGEESTTVVLKNGYKIILKLKE